MIGGELLSRGSGSCIFYPNLPCSSNKKDKNRISKIIYNSKSKELYDREKEINEIIRSIKGHKKWCVIFDEYCKPPPYNILKNYDKKGLKECLKKVSVPAFDSNSLMLNGLYGGNTLVSYFKFKFNFVKSGKKFEKDFLELMKMMRPLFLGLVELSKNNICHNDIKYNNIVYKDKKTGFKFIDFGLSTHLNKKDDFKKRSQREFNTSRIYVFYPLEYIYYFSKNNELEKEANKKRKNYDILKNIYKIFNLNIDDIRADTIYRLSNKRINFEEMVEKIDIYSLGIQIPLLFYNYSNKINPHEDSNVIQDFYLLFKEMCQPFSNNRITPEKALSKLDSLLKVHSNNNKKNLTKKKKLNNTKKKKTKKGK